MNNLNLHKGRIPGSKNATTTKAKEFINLLVEDNLEQLRKDLKSMKAVERTNFILKLLEYNLPKMRSVEMSTDAVQDNFKPITVILQRDE